MDRAQPGARGSTNRNIEFGETTGQYTDGWIVPADEPTLSAQRYMSLDETAFNEFDATWAADSLTVSIDPGEAFVDGWLAREVSTDLDLDADVSGQTVVVGWDPDAIYDDQQHNTRDEADKAIVALESAVDAMHPTIEVWTFDTDANGVINAEDHRQIGPVLSKNIVDGMALDRVSLVVSDPDRYAAAELDDQESYEVPIQLPDGHRLAVYRWGAYDANDNSTPTGLVVELLNEDDVVQASANTNDEYNLSEPIAWIGNQTGSMAVSILRVKNDTGSAIGDGDTDWGIGMHFGYLIEEV
jgi:hypothetical protein